MKKIPELDTLFDLTSAEPEHMAAVPSIVNDNQRKNMDQEDDYLLARNTLRSLIHKSEDTLDQMIELAKNSEHPRTYEVAGQLIKTVSDVAKDLMDLQKKVKDLKKDEPDNIKNITNNNVVFAGSTSELMKLLGKKDDGKTIEQ
jgi:gas vesicle protein